MIIVFRILLTITILIIFTCILLIKKNYIARTRINYKRIDEYISKKNIFINLNNYFTSLRVNNIKRSSYFTIIFSFIFSIIIYFISYKIFSIYSTSILISVFCFFIPYNFVKRLYYNKKGKILNMFPTYIITLKTYTQVTNDIIIAFKNAKVVEPLKTYIDRFNMYVEKGINVIEAFEILKKDIDISKISDFISSLQICYINGGDFSILLQRYANLLSKINLQREKEEQENFSSILVLSILVIINLILLFSFVFANYEYKVIITQTFVGKIILNINIVSYVFIYFMIKKISRKGV